LPTFADKKQLPALKTRFPPYLRAAGSSVETASRLAPALVEEQYAGKKLEIDVLYVRIIKIFRWCARIWKISEKVGSRRQGSAAFERGCKPDPAERFLPRDAKATTALRL
jgi:hypothetical protein